MCIPRVGVYRLCTLVLLLGLSIALWQTSLSSVTAQVTIPLPVKVPVPATVIYGDQFGASLAIDGDFLAVGAPNTNVGSNKQQGVVYLYKRDASNPDNFVMIKTLTGSNSAPLDTFGTAVALSGDTLVVGSIYADPDGLTNQGVAYLFQRNQGGNDNWGELKTLVRSDSEKLVNFGSAVAIHGDTIVIGSPTSYGRAFIYGRNEGGTNNWGKTQKLGNNLSDQNDRFGDAIVFNGETLVIGAPNGDLSYSDVPTGTAVPAYNNAGSVFVYKLENGQWTRKAKLFHSDSVLTDKSSFQIDFGGALALNGDLLFVGASNGKVNDVKTGKVFVYQLGAGVESPWGEPGGWGEVAKLSASDGAALDYFGLAIYASGDGVFVTAPHKAPNGVVYFYRNPVVGVNRASVAPAQKDKWAQVYSFSTSETVAGSWFGDPILSSGNNLLLGAYGTDNVFSYPLDAMLAADPNATATSTATPVPAIATPTGGTPVAKAIFLPLVARQGSAVIPPTTGILGNDQLLTGPGGMKFGAISNTLSASLAMTIAISSAPTQTLPDGVIVRGDYLQISGERNVATAIDSPFVIGVPVATGADTAHLALAYLNVVESQLDSDDGEPFWNFLDGLYDAESGLFLTGISSLSDVGTTFVLSENPDFETPPNGSAVQAAGTKVGAFTVDCKFFGTASDCTSTTEQQVAGYLDQIYHRMAADFGYTIWPRLRNRFGTILLKDKPSLAMVEGYTTVIVPQSHYFRCEDAGGYYQASSGMLALCLDPKTGVTEYNLYVLIHEYFHALENSYPKVLADANTVITPAGPIGGAAAVFKAKPWIIEGMAEASMESYFSDSTMLRFMPRTLQKVDTFLGAGTWGDKIYNEYDAQDFWIYLAQSHSLNLGYLGSVLEKGGASTAGVANALSNDFNEPFADLYWGWVKNQIFEKEYNLGGGLGTACELNTSALLTGESKHLTYSDLSNHYPITTSYETLPSLNSAVVEIVFPHTKQGALISVGYKECGNISLPVDREACVVEAQKLVHAKIYQQSENDCSAEVLPGTVTPYEGTRRVEPGAGKRFFVVVANGDLENDHEYDISIE